MNNYEKSLEKLKANAFLNPPATRDTLLGPVALVPINQNHIDFIFHSWLKSYKSAPAVKMVESDVYYAEQHKVIERLLLQCQTLVAVLPDDSNIIAGYVVFEKLDNVFTLHFGYVKHIYRQSGIFKALLAEAGITPEGGFYSHDTKPCRLIMPKYNLIYHPFLLSNYRGSNGQ